MQGTHFLAVIGIVGCVSALAVASASAQDNRARGGATSLSGEFKVAQSTRPARPPGATVAGAPSSAAQQAAGAGGRATAGLQAAAAQANAASGAVQPAGLALRGTQSGAAAPGGLSLSGALGGAGKSVVEGGRGSPATGALAAATEPVRPAGAAAVGVKAAAGPAAASAVNPKGLMLAALPAQATGQPLAKALSVDAATKLSSGMTSIPGKQAKPADKRKQH
jgi:hypothetical protein